jgi:hypothetical protein
MVTFEAAIVWRCFCSAASAFRAFLWASFSARFWASTERVEVAAARASDHHRWLAMITMKAKGVEKGMGSRERSGDRPSDHSLSYISAWFFCSQSWHFLTVPPNSQYYFLFLSVCVRVPFSMLKLKRKISYLGW